ncbi:hypothetical protein Tco_0723397 [Tanacetum coccineum]
MEEYIRLKEEKAQKHGKVFNWETAKYGKIWYDEDVLDLISVETKFPAFVFNDNLTSNETPSCEPTNKFPAIVYNDALTSKSDFSTKPTLYPQHIDEFDFTDETSSSKYDEEEQNVLYFYDLFPFNIIYPDDQKSDKDNDDNEIDTLQSLGGGQDMALPPRDQRYQYLRYEGLQYTNADIAYCKTRLARIYRRDVHRVQVFDFGGLPDLMAEGLSGWGLQVSVSLGGARHHLSWRQFILALGLHTAKEMETVGFASSYTSIRDLILRLYHRLIACSIAGRSQAPEKVTVTDLFYLRGMDVGSVNIPYLLARYLRLFSLGRKKWAMISRAPRPERQLDATASAPRAAEHAFAIDKEDGQLEEDVHEVAGGIAQLLDSTGASYTPYSDTHIPYQRRVRHKTDSASTSAAQIKPGSKFSTVAREYVTEPCRLSKSRVELRRESVYKSVKAKEKSNLKTS